MARGDYTVQEVEAAKQAGRDNSYRTCVLTMFIFLVLCIILLVIAWTTWKPTREKDAYSYQDKYGGKVPTSSVSTGPPIYESEEPTTMKTHHPVAKTTQAIGTSAAIESHNPTNFTIRPATTTTATPTTTTTTATITTPDLTTTTTERPLQQPKGSTDFITPATISSTEQQTMFILSAANTEKSGTQSEHYDMPTKAIKGPAERTITTSTTPISSLDPNQPLSTTTEKTSMYMEGTSDDESGRVTSTQTNQTEYTVPHAEKSEQPPSATDDLPDHWQLRTPISTDLPDATQHSGYKTTPDLVQPEAETTSDTETPLTYETTDFMHSAENETKDPMKNLTTPATKFNLSAESTPVNNQSVFTTSNVSTASHTSTAASTQSTTDRSTTPSNATFNTTDTESTTPMNFLTPSSSSSPDIQPIHTLVITDRSTTPSNATFNTTDVDSTTPMNFLTPSSSSSPDIQPIHTLVITDRSTTLSNATFNTTDVDSTTPMNFLTPSTSSSPDIQPIHTLVITDRSTTLSNATFNTTDVDSTTPMNFLTPSTSSSPDIQPIHTLVITDRSTTLSNATFNTTDVDSTTPMNFLTPSSSSSPDIQPIHTLVITDRSTTLSNATFNTTDVDSTTPMNFLTPSSSSSPDIQPIHTLVITDRSTTLSNATFNTTDVDSTTPMNFLTPSTSSSPDIQPIHTLVITDRSTTPSNATFNTTDVDSTTPMNFLTPSSSSSPDIQPIHILVITDRSTTPSNATFNTTDVGSTTPMNFLTPSSSSSPDIQPIHTLVITDRSTTPSNATFNTTDVDSTTPMNFLTPSSSSSSDIQPIRTLVITDISTDSTANTSDTGSTDATDSSVSDIGDLSSQSVSSVPPTVVSKISTTTCEPLCISVTGPTTAAVTTQRSPTASDEKSVMSLSSNSQENTANDTVAPEQTEHCTTSACKVVASRMLSLMNHSVEPCEDFYEYACGGLRENRNLLQHNPEYEVWTRIVDAMKQINTNSSAAFIKFKSFYDQCLMFDSIVNKTSRLEETRKVLANVGKMYNRTGWAARNLNLNLTSLLVKLFQLNSAPLFDVQLDVDIHNTSKFSLKLTAPSHQSKFQLESSFAARCKAQIVQEDGNNVNLKDVYLKKYLPCTRDYGEYMNITEKALKELGMFKDLGPFHESQYIQELRIFIEFQILHHLTELPLAGEMRHSLVSKQFISLSVADLQTKYPQVNWKTLLSALVGDTVDRNTNVQLYFERYFDRLFDNLHDILRKDNVDRMNLHNALLAMFAHDLYMDLVQTQSPCSRADYCLRVASGLLEEVSSALYLSTFMREQLDAMKVELQALFSQLKLALKEQFEDAEWLDDSSRSYLTSKLQQLTAVTDGGRVFLGDYHMLNQRLSHVDMNSSNSYLHNAVQLMRWYRSGMYSLYHAEPNLTDTIWSHFLLPYNTQAVAIYQLNIVVIPFGLIGSPQNTSDLPAYISEARFGNDLAQQIAHHFDAIGIEYGSSGKDRNLLSDITKFKYNTTHDCDEMLHSNEKSWTNHKRQVFTYQVDTSQSMNERFADSSALQLAYKIYKRNAGSQPLLPWLDMNHDQLYHLLVAQEFCTKGGMLDYTIQLFESEQMPPFLRVTNMAQNSKAFSEAYSCVLGTHMNPENKCNSFPELKDFNVYSPELSTE